VALVTGCAGSSGPGVAADGPQPSPSLTGPVTQGRLEAMLLQPADLAGLGGRRAYAGAGLTTQATPQLALCREPAPVGPHQVANVVATSSRPGGVKVFEVLSVFQDEVASKGAYDAAVATAEACDSYVVGGLQHRLVGLARVDVGAGAEALHYAVVTSDVVSGDVRTLARQGSVVVLITGFGEPPTKQPLLAYQADLMRKALARLR
jgi:hypothetical protein